MKSTYERIPMDKGWGLNKLQGHQHCKCQDVSERLKADRCTMEFVCGSQSQNSQTWSQIIYRKHSKIFKELCVWSSKSSKSTSGGLLLSYVVLFGTSTNYQKIRRRAQASWMVHRFTKLVHLWGFDCHKNGPSRSWLKHCRWQLFKVREPWSWEVQVIRFLRSKIKRNCLTCWIH